MRNFDRINRKEDEEGKVGKGKLFLSLFIVLLVVGGIITAAYSLNIFGTNGAPSIPDPIVLGPGTDVQNSGSGNPEGNINEPPRSDRREGVNTFLVFGVDKSGKNTDVIMLVVYDTKNNKINILNIPRDTYSVANNRSDGLKHINLAYSYKGIDQLKYEIMHLIGYNVDWYVKINMQGFIKLINYIGGVYYNVPVDMKHGDPTNDMHIDLKKGPQTLYGPEALQFIRYREKTKADIGRIERRNDFLKELARQLLSSQNAVKAAELAGVVFDNVDTDIKSSDLIWFAKKAVSIKPENVIFHTFPGGPAKDSGMWIPYKNELLELLNEYFNPLEKPIENINIVSRSENQGK